MDAEHERFVPRLRIVECEGHGRYFEVYDRDEYVGTFERDESICAAFGGRVAAVYGYAAYEAACAEEIRRDPEGWDCSDVSPAPVLARVRTLEEIGMTAWERARYGPKALGGL
jgi:hypothetical protein